MNLSGGGFHREVETGGEKMNLWLKVARISLRLRAWNIERSNKIAF
jgi:hypothetical protein